MASPRGARYSRPVLSVKELRKLASRFTAAEFKRQLGPFALIQRPADEVVQRMAVDLGAQRTMANITRQTAETVQALMFEFEDLEVATLPEIRRDEPLSVGRLPDCDLVIDDPSVSKKHAALEWDDTLRRCSLTDLKSTNGTLLNGCSMAAPEMNLKDGDVISFGNAQFVYLLTDTLYARLGGGRGKFRKA